MAINTDIPDFTSKAETARALLALYAQQELDEQMSQYTTKQNGVGFNQVDAPFCSSVAQWILDGKPFTDKQFAGVVKLLPKYKKQLQGLPWRDIVLPPTLERQPVEKAEKKDGAGFLDIEKDHLRFYPYVYPSKQIMNLGFGYEKVGKYWYSRYFSVALVEQVQAMFKEHGKVYLSEEVQARIDQLSKAKELPKAIKEHKVLFPFQKESVSFLLGANRAMLALAPGLGKTACSIFAAEACGAKKVLVVAPLTLIRNWQREIKKWIDQDAVLWHGTKLIPQYHTGWAVTNYETAVKALETLAAYKFDLVILDESVMVKNRKAKRTRAMGLLAKSSTRCWLLSGSPTTRFYDDMWAQMNILNPQRYSSYWRWTNQYCYVFNNGWGEQITANKPDAAARIQTENKDVYFARTQDQVLDLPEWIFDDIEVEMDTQQSKIYEAMEEDFIANLPSGDVVLAPNVLAQITRLVQFASNPQLVQEGAVAEEITPTAKWAAVAEMLQFEELPAIVWTNYISTANYLTTYLENKGYRVAKLTGATKEKERQQTVDDFQNGHLDVIVAHPGVGKFGLTLTRARTAIYLERSYNGDDYYQSLHRVRRIGTEHSPHVIHLQSVKAGGGKTIDHVIAKILAYRKDQSISLTTGMLEQEFGINE